MDRCERIKKDLESAQKANSNGILMSYRVTTMKDERVCPDCLKFEGYTASVSEAVIGVNHPPFHDSCRCLALYQVDGIKPQNK